MTLRTSVIGIDGSGKSTTISKVFDELSSNYRVAKTGRPMYIGDNGNRVYVFGGFTGAMDNLHAYFDEIGSTKGIVVANAANVSLQPLFEKRIIDKFNPDILIASRDMTICPAVYITYYVKPSRKISTELRMKMFNVIRINGYPDKIVHLEVDPVEAYRRIGKRIEQERGTITERNKWRQLHENPSDLSELRKYYLEAIDIGERMGLDIRTISTKNGQEKVVDEMSKYITDDL